MTDEFDASVSEQPRPPDKLKSKATGAVLWSAVAKIGEQGIRFAVSIFLARLLIPEDFGLIAMLSIFMMVGRVLVESGLGSALIQRQVIDATDCATVFWSNLLVACLIHSLLWWCAPFIADFYGEPRLILLTQILAFNLVGNAICVVPTSLLDRDLRFRDLARVGILSATFSAVIALYVAFKGWGVWSLVVLQLSSLGTRALGLFLITRWTPSFKWSFNRLREMLTYAGPLLSGGIIGNICENLYQAVIGKVYSAESLGFYYKSRQIQFATSSQLSGILGRVMFPTLSNIQQHPQRLLRGIRTYYSMFAFLGLPTMALMAISAEPTILFLLTDKWQQAVPYLRLFCVIGAMFPFTIAAINALKAVGHTKSLLKVVFLRNSLDLVVLVSAYRFGIMALLAGKICVNFIVLMYFSNLVRRGTGYALLDQLRDVVPYLASSVVAGTLTGLVLLIPTEATWFTLGLQITVFASVYCIFCHTYHLPSYLLVVETIREKFWKRIK